MTKDCVVVIYAKWPILGKCKTRIEKDIGREFALEFSLSCLDDLVENVSDSNHYDLLVATNTKDELKKFNEKYGLDGMLTESLIEDKLVAQSQRLNGIFFRLSQQYSRMILIPIDLPFLSEKDMISSFARLNENDFVHGPELDGGIYLIGVKSPYERDIFQDVRWSTSHSFNDLMRNCRGKNIYKLKLRSDLNTFQDVLNARRGIAHHCPNVFKLLVKEGYYIPEEEHYIDFDTLPINISVVSAIVQRNSKNGREILIQTRYKPTIDPVNSGKIEIPGGLMDRFETAYETVVREVNEETGLDVKVLGISNHYRYDDEENTSISYEPFSCNQQLRGKRAYFGITFLCEVIGGKLQENLFETRDPRWISVNELSRIIDGSPEMVFPFQVPILKKYLDYIKNG